MPLCIASPSDAVLPSLQRCCFSTSQAFANLAARQLPAVSDSLAGAEQLHALQDVMMPDVDGLELLKHVRGESSYAHIPVVSECTSLSHNVRFATYGPFLHGFVCCI